MGICRREEHGEALGLSTERIIELREAIETARDAFQAADRARLAAQTATLRLHQAVKTMHSAPGMGQDSLDTIRLTASTTDDRGVYTLAQIEPPQTDSMTPPPQAPTRVRSELLPMGEVRLSWKCKVPAGSQGTLYQIERAVDGDITQSRFTFAGISGERTFIDASLPAGPTRAEYRITAIRGKQRSHASLHTMQFGVVRGQRPILRAA